MKNKALFSVDADGARYKNIKSDEGMPVSEWSLLDGTCDNQRRCQDCRVSCGSLSKSPQNGKMVHPERVELSTF